MTLRVIAPAAAVHAPENGPVAVLGNHALVVIAGREGPTAAVGADRPLTINEMNAAIDDLDVRPNVTTF